MLIEDFFANVASLPWSNDPITEPRMEVIRSLGDGPIPGDNDLESAISLTRLVHSELEEFATHANTQRLNDDQIASAQRSLKAVLARHGIDLTLPWRDYKMFRTFWLNEGAKGEGSWQARREMLASRFGPVYAELDKLEDAHFSSTLAEPVSPATGTGWPGVDQAVHDLRVRFRTAMTTADYSDVGRRCIAVLEALSTTVYDPAKHLRDGEDVPPIAKTHQRILRFVEDGLSGAGNVEVRALARKSAELAEAVKHRSGATRRDAGIAADATILLANILRRIVSE